MESAKITEKDYIMDSMKKIDDGISKLNKNVSDINVSMGILSTEMKAIDEKIDEKFKALPNQYVDKKDMVTFYKWLVGTALGVIAVVLTIIKMFYKP